MKEKHLNYCKTFDKLIKIAKCHYESNEICSKFNNKKLWQYINDKLDKKTYSNNNIDYIVSGEDKIYNQNEIANVFVNFFSNVGLNLAEKMGTNNNTGNFTTINCNERSLFLKPTDAYEIIRVINELKDKSGGVNGITTKVLKELSEHISEP